jgi:hypothetical protein
MSRIPNTDICILCISKTTPGPAISGLDAHSATPQESPHSTISLSRMGGGGGGGGRDGDIHKMNHYSDMKAFQNQKIPELEDSA